MAERGSSLSSGDALLVVDVQRDFCAGGSLAVPGGDEVVPVMNAWIREAERAGVPVIASRDWHPPDHMSFVQRGGPWPPHCVQGSEGAKFHPDLRLPESVHVVSNASDPDREAYSAFDDSDLEEYLRERGVRRVVLGGLAQDVCVRASALGALERGFDVAVLVDATRPIDAEAGERTLGEVEERGGEVWAGLPPGEEG